MTDIEIKPSTIDDISAMIHLSIDLWGVEGTFRNEEFVQIINENMSLSLWSNGSLIGYCLCSGKNDEYFTNVASIPLLLIHKDHRGKGYGDKILSRCIDNAYSNYKHRYFSLHVEVRNTIAIRLYEKLGFTMIKTVSNYYNDTKDDAYYMIKEIN